MTAFANVHTKTGAGRQTRQPDPIRNVEAAVCRAGFGTLPPLLHELVADARARFTCRHCRRTWAELDAELREAS